MAGPVGCCPAHQNIGFLIIDFSYESEIIVALIGKEGFNETNWLASKRRMSESRTAL